MNRYDPNRFEHVQLHQVRPNRLVVPIFFEYRRYTSLNKYRYSGGMADSRTALTLDRLLLKLAMAEKKKGEKPFPEKKRGKDRNKKKGERLFPLPWCSQNSITGFLKLRNEVLSVLFSHRWVSSLTLGCKIIGTGI